MAVEAATMPPKAVPEWLQLLAAAAHDVRRSCSGGGSAAADGAMMAPRPPPGGGRRLEAMQQAAGTAASVLLKVPAFAEQAGAGCALAAITADGHVDLSGGSDDNGGAGGDSTSAPEPTQQQQQQQQQRRRQQRGDDLDPQTQSSVLAAAVVSRLVLHADASPGARAAAASALLGRLLPQLLACQVRCEPGSLGGHPASPLVAAAAQLHAAGHPAAAGVAGDCARRALELLGEGHGPPGDRQGRAAEGSGLRLGDAACLALLAALLRQRCLPAAALQQLAERAPGAAGRAGRGAREELQGVLLAPLLDAAAEQLPAPAYAAACASLVEAAAAGAAAAAGGGGASAAAVTEGLTLACRLQPHIVHACRQPGAPAAGLLAELLLCGCSSGDPHCRRRALHLLEACLQAECGPQVPGFGGAQWLSWTACFRALEQHLLHLVDPVWRGSFHVLLERAGDGGSAGGGGGGGGAGSDGGAAALVRWCGVLLVRAASHTNVSVRRLGLTSLLELPPSTLQQLVERGAWERLRSLLLELLAAFGDKLVGELGGGSAMGRRAKRAAELQQQLSAFLAGCFAALRSQLQQQQQQQRPDALAELTESYLQRVAAVAESSPAALVLLRALVAAASSSAGDSSSAAGGSGRLCDMHPLQLVAAVGGMLAAANHLHPPHLRPELQAAALQLAPLCCRPEGCGTEAALQLLAAGGMQAAAAEGFLAWLDAVLSAAPSGPPAEPSASAPPAPSCQLQAWLRLAAATARGAPQPPSKLLFSLGEASPRLSPRCQQAVAEELEAGAAGAVGAAAADPALAALACGVAAAISCRVAAAGETTAATAGEHGACGERAAAPLASALAQLAPALFQRHLSRVMAGGASYDAGLCGWITRLARSVAQAPAATGPAGQGHAWEQAQRAVRAELLHWVPRLPDDVAAARASGELDRQLLLLTTAQLACTALQQEQQQERHQQEQQQDYGVTGLDAAACAACLEDLCRLQPAAAFSAGFEAEGSSGVGSSSRSGGNSRAELTEQLLLLRSSVVAELVRAAGPWLPASTRRAVFERCVDDLEWSSDEPALRPLLQTLLLIAPWSALELGSSMQERQVARAPGCQPPQSEDAAGCLLAMLRRLQPLVRGGRRLSAPCVRELVQLAVHPALFRNQELRGHLERQLIPFALAHGGARVSCALASHLCAVLGADQGLLASHAPHVVHLAAFSLFAASVEQEEALAAQRRDASVLLPARVLVCSWLQSLASRRAQPAFLRSVVLRLLDAAQAEGAYGWLAAREAGQASAANAIKVATWQALCLLAPHVDDALALEAIDRGWECLLRSHQHGNVRPHVQLFLLALLRPRPDEAAARLLPALADYASASHQVAVSVIVVALFHLLSSPGPQGDPHFAPTLRALLPWALHHRHAVRVPVQALLHVVFERHMGAVASALGAGDAALLSGLRRFLTDNAEVAKIREHQGVVDLQGFSLARETSLEGVLGVREGELAQLCDGETDATGLLWPVHVRSRLPLDVLSSLPGALKALNRFGPAAGAGCSGSAAEQAAAGQAEEGDEEVEEDGEGQEDGGRGHGGSGDGGAGQAQAAPGAGPAVHQLRPQLQLELLDDACSSRIDGLLARRAAVPGLVVCASLLDNLPNLAGLCRTCESLGVEALALPSRAVVESDAFKRQSVTSERWLQLLEVRAADAATFLRERRAAGYAILGVEQASNSVALQDYRFPRRSVLLLGNEQNGIPGPLLHLLDVCLEIPMIGVTRSLNAHVSGAMAVWQYTQQRLGGSLDA